MHLNILSAKRRPFCPGGDGVISARQGITLYYTLQWRHNVMIQVPYADCFMMYRYAVDGVPLCPQRIRLHYGDVIMTTMASKITSLTVVYSTVYSDADQIKHQSSASLTFVWGTHRDRWIPRTKGQLRGKCFHLMTSPWAPNRRFHWGMDTNEWEKKPR